jgi:hypothetical protein
MDQQAQLRQLQTMQFMQMQQLERTRQVQEYQHEQLLQLRDQQHHHIQLLASSPAVSVSPQFARPLGAPVPAAPEVVGLGSADVYPAAGGETAATAAPRVEPADEAYLGSIPFAELYQRALQRRRAHGDHHGHSHDVGTHVLGRITLEHVEADRKREVREEASHQLSLSAARARHTFPAAGPAAVALAGFPVAPAANRPDMYRPFQEGAESGNSNGRFQHGGSTPPPPPPHVSPSPARAEGAGVALFTGLTPPGGLVSSAVLTHSSVSAAGFEGVDVSVTAADVEHRRMMARLAEERHLMSLATPERRLDVSSGVKLTAGSSAAQPYYRSTVLGLHHSEGAGAGASTSAASRRYSAGDVVTSADRAWEEEAAFGNFRAASPFESQRRGHLPDAGPLSYRRW